MFDIYNREIDRERVLKLDVLNQLSSAQLSAPRHDYANGSLINLVNSSLEKVKLHFFFNRQKKLLNHFKAYYDVLHI